MGCVVVYDIFYSFLVYMLGNCFVLVGGVKKGTSFCRNIVPAKKNSWQVTLDKKGTWEGILFFYRNLEVIPQNSWNWKAKTKERKKECKPRIYGPFALPTKQYLLPFTSYNNNHETNVS
jgi:hypothetical protein